MFKSLRERFVLWFLLMAFAIGCVIFPLNYFYNKTSQKFRKTTNNLNELHKFLLKDTKSIHEFLLSERLDQNFYLTGESPSLFKHEDFHDSINQILQNYTLNQSEYPTNEAQYYNTIDSLYNSYSNIVDSLIYLIYKHGYRDFGLEGEMASYMYQLEKNKKITSFTAEIRKNERDYLIRNDSAYASNVNSLVKGLSKHISSWGIADNEKSNLLTSLNNYHKSFIKLVYLNSKIGISSNTGFTPEFYAMGELLDHEINTSIKIAQLIEQKQLAKLNILCGLIALILIAGSIIFSLYISRKLINHLEALTHYMSEITRYNLNHSVKLNLRYSSTEIRRIYKEFRNMVAQLKIRETQRDRALRAAYESEQRYRELADLLPQSIFETDKLGNLVYANKTWYRDFGYTIEDLKQGLNLIEIINSNNSRKLFETNKIENSEYIAIRKDKTKFPATVYADNIVKDGKNVGRIGIIIDSTLRHKYIETLKNETLRAITSDKHKSYFLANMSHEIRTPMNSIIGFANLLAMPEIPGEQKCKFIQYIQSGGQILLNLIDDIIDVAKIEAGEIKIKQGACNPNQIIDELTNTFEGFKVGMGKENIKLITKKPDEKVIFKTDAFRVRQILTNLISNAIKFTEAGNVTVEYETIANRVVRFTVSDTGYGLTSDELKTIFDRFKRTKSSETRNITGTGLGLSISKNLVELLGGQLWVNSEPGIGTKFWFELPYITIVENKDVYNTNKPSKQNEHFQWADRTFLIAEDDDASYSLIKEILYKTGVRLVRAINGKEVVEAVKFSEDIDLILMDIQMPLQNGFESTRQIKEFRPDLPVIAQTAFAMEGDKEKSILAGCDDYIAKPIQPDKLLLKIKQFLKTDSEQPLPDTKLNLDNKAVIKNISFNRDN